jgi:transcriptional regulator with XRE-family HTH domain
MYQKDHNLMKKAIGNIIRIHRENMNLSEEKLSWLVYKKSAQLTVSKTELGKRNLPSHELIEYLSAFSVNPEIFFRQVQKEFSRLSKK